MEPPVPEDPDGPDVEGPVPKDVIVTPTDPDVPTEPPPAMEPVESWDTTHVPPTVGTDWDVKKPLVPPPPEKAVDSVDAPPVTVNPVPNVRVAKLHRLEAVTLRPACRRRPLPLYQQLPL